MNIYYYDMLCFIRSRGTVKVYCERMDCISKRDVTWNRTKINLKGVRLILFIGFISRPDI